MLLPQPGSSLTKEIHTSSGLAESKTEPEKGGGYAAFVFRFYDVLSVYLMLLTHTE